MAPWCRCCLQYSDHHPVDYQSHFELWMKVETVDWGCCQMRCCWYFRQNYWSCWLEAVGWVGMPVVVFAAVLDCSHWDSQIEKGRHRWQRRRGKAAEIVNY
ncbi:MAG: hypothetical protein ACJ04P_10405 [Halioglobus sp.]